MALAVALLPVGGDPHRVPIAISGPLIVASSTADQADRRADEALEAHPVGSAAAARREVRDGTVVAAVDIDLRRDRTTLFVASAQGEQVTRAVAASVRPIADTYGVTVTVTDVVPAPHVWGSSWALRVLAAAAVSLGLGLAVLVTWHRGPVADDRRESTWRVLVVVTSTSLGAAVLASVAATWIGGTWAAWWAVLALTAIAVSALTLALESVLGVAGLGLATTAAVATAAPLLRVDRADLLAQPWRAVTPWLPHGAALDVFRDVAFFGGATVMRPLLVLGSWVIVSMAVLIVARRERRRAGVRWSADRVARADEVRTP